MIAAFFIVYLSFASGQSMGQELEPEDKVRVRNLPAEEDLDSQEQSKNPPAANQSFDEHSDRTKKVKKKVVRRLDDVIGDLLTKFGEDVHQGQVKGLPHLALGRLAIAPSLPKSYKGYLRMLITEQIHENSLHQLIKCMICQKQASKEAQENPMGYIVKLEDEVARNDIRHFLNAVLSFHRTSVVLFIEIVHAHTKKTVSSHQYDSKVIRSRTPAPDKKLDKDFKDYITHYRFLLGFGGGGIPNLSGVPQDSQMLAMLLRFSELYNERRFEFGIQILTYLSMSSLTPNSPDAAGERGTQIQTESEDSGTIAIIPFEQALSPYGIFAYNFSTESNKLLKFSLNAGAGLLMATGYMTRTLRFGTDVYLGKRFGFHGAIVYLASSAIDIDGQEVITAGGIGLDFAAAINF